MSESKNIILCFDGTTNEYGSNNTNVVKIYSMLAKEHPTKQVVYYQPGLGMYFDPGTVNPVVPFLFNLAQGFDWSFAWYLYQHVIDGYRFIMQNWNAGDRLYIFGFSRGAYTARCVAGMVQKIGVLPKDNEQSLAYAYGLYERTDTEGIALASSYKRAFCRDVKTDFLGCFDTVASVGLIIARELPFTSNNAGVKRFRHALALDEHRFRFTYSAWKGPCPFPTTEFPIPPTPAVRIPASLSASIASLWWKLNHPIELYYQWEGTLDKIKAGQRPNIAQVIRPGVPFSLTDLTPKVQSLLTAGVPTTAAHKILEDDKCERPAEISELHESSHTDVKEVWFAGCHSDIGGCAAADNVAHSLGDITLRWMVKELVQSGLPVEWNKGALEDLYGDELDQVLGKAPPSNQGSKLDAVDAKAPIHDDLKYPVWWTFELPPLSWTWQDIKGNWYRQWRPNLARGRHIEGTPTLHPSVRMRMADPTMRYKPRANIHGPPNWEQ